MIPSIRPVRPGDRDDVYAICLRTADAGDDGSHLYEDPELPGHVWAGAYVALEPEHGFVVSDGQDRAVGYVLGALDSRSFEALLEREWWPPLRQRYPLTTERDLVGDRIAVHLIHHPSRADEAIVADHPSHLHIDLLPEAQGTGHGRRLIDRLLEALAADGSSGVHLGVSARNERAIGFYRALGFTELLRDDRHLVFGRALR
jgi:ribosomal protein S18 acetylase RimI-like enzyme